MAEKLEKDGDMSMRFILSLFIVTLSLSFYSCEKVSPNVVELSVDFSWKGISPCDRGNPEIRFSGVPEKTKFITIHMYDHEYQYNHGKVTIPYTDTENGIIKKGRFKEIEGPCPPGTPGRYEITIKAIDEEKVVIGIGSKERYFPE